MFEDTKGQSEAGNQGMTNKRKRTKIQTMILRTPHRKLKIEQHKTGSELRCSGRVSSSCSNCGTPRVTLVTNPHDKL